MRAFKVEILTLDGTAKYSMTLHYDTIDGAVDELAYLSRPIALFAIDTKAQRPEDRRKDVSADAAILLACRVADGRITLTDAIRDFIERHSMPGSLISAAA